MALAISLACHIVFLYQLGKNAENPTKSENQGQIRVSGETDKHTFNFNVDLFDSETLLSEELKKLF